MKINWKIRFKNKNFWIALIPTFLMLLKQILHLFGVEMDFSDLSNQLIDIVGTIFMVLAILGVVNDPTTATLNDSINAMHYDKPKEY